MEKIKHFASDKKKIRKEKTYGTYLKSHFPLQVSTGPIVSFTSFLFILLAIGYLFNMI